MQDTSFPKDQSMVVKGKIWNFNKVLTMAILNLTDDSFYADSRVIGRDALLERVDKALSEGADILDIGAHSTRPGAPVVPENQESERLTSAIHWIRKDFPEATISADTYRAAVAKKAVQAGADIINDVGGGSLDGEMFKTIAQMGVPYVLMHMRGNPQNMATLTDYHDVVNDVIMDLSEKLSTLRDLGVSDVIIDPGIGFAKTTAQNFEMLMRLKEFEIFKVPLLIGVSRKGIIHKTLKIDPGQAGNGTTALHMLALERGAQILRVHDVREARESIRLWEECRPFIHL